ncbi:hypothetical protein F5Y18DRAFT_377618 [Xylariaceae sp. FL1019]|nr:hypothetical protein F5Y18DRAFT_377618 [Xylariaceae sp. FL1019]
MHFASLFALGLMGQAEGVPNIPLVSTLEHAFRPYTACQNYTDTFDDLKPDPIIQKNRIGHYNGLDWEAWIYFGTGLDGTTVNGVIPESGDQIAATGPSSDLLQIGVVTLTPFGNIVASPAKSFDLYSFYFGCVFNPQENFFSVATGCTITITGFDTKGVQLPPITVAYTPSNPLRSPMDLVTLPDSYRNIKNITIGLPVSLPTPLFTALLVDDVKHCNH